MTIHATTFTPLARTTAAARQTHAQVCLVHGLRAGTLIRFRWRDDPRLLEGTIATEACGCRDRLDGRRPHAVDGAKGLHVEAALPGRDHLDIQLAGRIAYCGVPVAWCALPAAAAVTLFDELAGAT